VISIQLVETVGDGRLESGKLIIVLRVQAFFGSGSNMRIAV